MVAQGPVVLSPPPPSQPINPRPLPVVAGAGQFAIARQTPHGISSNGGSPVSSRPVLESFDIAPDTAYLARGATVTALTEVQPAAIALPSATGPTPTEQIASPTSMEETGGFELTETQAIAPLPSPSEPQHLPTTGVTSGLGISDRAPSLSTPSASSSPTLSTPSTSSTSLTDGATAELPLEPEESAIALSSELVFRVLEADELPSLLGQKLDAATARLVRALAEGDTQGAIAAADVVYTLQFANHLDISPEAIAPNQVSSTGPRGSGARANITGVRIPGDSGPASIPPEEAKETEQEAVDAQAEALADSQGFVNRVETLLRTWGDRTGKNFAILYPLAFADRLELLLITGTGQTIRKTVSTTNKTQLRYLIGQFRQELTHPFTRNDHSYRAIAQRLYGYLIEPVSPYLDTAQINSLLIAPGPQLRSVPYGALMKGDRFLIQDYGITLVPSFQAIESDVELKREGAVLAMGASNFAELSPLPYANAEVEVIPAIFEPGGDVFTDEAFTEHNFAAQRQRKTYPIIHLATHANFRDGQMDNSYIQFWDNRLSLRELERLRLGDPMVDLLILSACKTAVGSESAELGFAGLTIKSGVRTAIASQWDVDDAATMILMTYFYYFWNDPAITTKAEALQRAQLFVLENRSNISPSNQLILPNGQAIALPLDPKDDDPGDRPNLTHPFFWSAFTTIGSPW